MLGMGTESNAGRARSKPDAISITVLLNHHPLQMEWMQTILPKIETRQNFDVFSGVDWAVLGAPFVVLALAGVLAIKQPRDPLGESLRMLLLPLGVYAFFVQCTFRNFWFGVPEFNPLNYCVALGAFTAGLGLVQMTFVRQSPKRDGKPSTGTVRDALSYIGDPRGIHWDVGSKPPRAPETRDLKDRGAFLQQTAWWLVQDLLVTDLCQIIFQLSPTTITAPTGGSIYVDSLPTVQKYALSSLLTVTMGWEVYASIDGGYQAFTLFNVGIMGEDPADHPPVLNQPWAATSVRQLWSRRWQNMYRSYYGSIGAPIGEFFLGKAGAVLAVFTLTGIMHAPTMWGMGRGTGSVNIIGFFVLQGVGVLLEEGWRMITGKQVDGIWGRIWAWIWVLSTAHLVVEAWLTRGIAGRPSALFLLARILNIIG